MKKILLLFVSLFMWTGFVFSQTTLYEDNLDTYPANSFLAVENPEWWSTWSNLPGSGEDIQIKTTFSHSTPNSGLCDVTSGTATDGILLLGDKVSGSYEVTWWMYIETSKCGYYNFQHFESPGIEWAFEIYFRTNGDFNLLHSGLQTDGTYPKATWFECKHVIDLDADLITLYVNGTLVESWPFSDQAGQEGGTKQLGAVDFYAGAYSGSGESPLFYIDDVSYIENTSGNDPIIGVDPDSVYKSLLDGTTGTEPLTVSNTGLSDLNFDVNIIYDIAKKSPFKSSIGNESPAKKVLTKVIVDPTPNPGGSPEPPSDATAVLHYDGDNSSAVGWNTVPVNVTVAARFPNSMTLPYAGMEVTSVEVYVNDLNTSGSNLMKVRLYDMGNSFEPGPLLYEQEFTPGGYSWETITLTTPVMVTGGDLWVGYNLTQTDAGIYIPGTDGGPADPNGDFWSTGVGWSHLAPTLDYNWNIRANLVGDPIFQWLSVAPMSGIVAPDTNLPLTLTFDATSLDALTYHATVKLLSNDPATPILDVPVTLDVFGVGIEEIGKIGVMVYPNPSKDMLNIVSNGTVNKVTISDFSGKVVFDGNSKAIDIRALSNGLYFIKVETTKGISNIKFVKN